ncbi:uncharacterized protein LOC133349592 [Lethenteron reissneri]|uniref:uncharacterized protein LOC133349592 n=1 Tax=Lethenteron reissneri TaxID=7753 RepID=UPI002AB5EB6F|nr:uncharacterized protein LOC133349592 [Lethenteron reissneri]
MPPNKGDTCKEGHPRKGFSPPGSLQIPRDDSAPTAFLVSTSTSSRLFLNERFSTAGEMSPSLARGVVIWAAVCAAVCAAWPQDDCSPARSPRPRPASHGTRPARPRSSAAERSNDAAVPPAAEGDGVAAAGERTGSGRGPNRHKIHGRFNMDTWACPGMESRTCTNPSDCQGCYGLFTCSRTRRLCVHKRVARKTGIFQASLLQTR